MDRRRKWQAILIVTCLLLGTIGIADKPRATTYILKKVSPTFHDFTGLPLDENGWTNFPYMVYKQGLYKDARVVFVSSTEGEDSSAQPYGIDVITFDRYGIFQPKGEVNAYRTITKGYEQLRDGKPDILLLKRGDEWQERFDSGSIGRWDKSGPSKEERIVLASYGVGIRPTLKIGNGTGFVPYYAHNLIVTGIRFYSHTWQTETPGRGTDVIAGQENDHLYEDCIFERNVSRVQNFMSLAFRRNQFIEGKTGDLTAKLYAFDGDNLLIEENTFYSPLEQNRHLYLATQPGINLAGVVLHANIFYTSRRTGISYRSGGILDNNLIIRNDQILAGGTGGSKDLIKSFNIVNNVILESAPDSCGDGEYAIRLQNNDGSSISDNILADASGLSCNNVAFRITGDENVNIAKNIEIQNNIVYGRAATGQQSMALYTENELEEVANVNIHDNDFQMVNGAANIITHNLYAAATKRFDGFLYSNNDYYSSDPTDTWFTPGGDLAGWISESGETDAQAIRIVYPDPNRNLKTYNNSLGGEASTDKFMEEALKQGRNNWRPEYSACEVNNYIREGFGKEAVACGSR